jgi:hypothetical protein
MSTSDHIGLAGLAVACATAGISIAAVRPSWPGAVTWSVISVFLALAAVFVTILGRDMTRRRTRPDPEHEDQPPIPAPPLPITPSSVVPPPSTAIDLTGSEDALIEDSLFEGFDRPIHATDSKNLRSLRNRMLRH